MSLFLDVLAWACIVMGTLGAVLTLVALTIGRAKPSMTKPGARSGAWRVFRYSLVPVAGGVGEVVFLASESKDDTAGWPAVIVTLTVVFWDFGLWFRSRMRRKSGGPAAEPS
jgi:hypothetical protein